MKRTLSSPPTRSRAIRLSRVHAINWYGYNDTLDVEGHLLLAGVTGSGKSVLMDLVQLVLVGADRALFNRSATGTTSDRTLKSYVLCDTKREENGQPQYVRDKGAITYVAMEFTWPGGQRAETWGLRIEFRNAAENLGRVSPFFCDGRLEKKDFLDADRRPLELAAFRRLIEKERDGRLFETQDQYLRDMANDRHLNFNRGVLATLLPTAMSFTNLKSFDEFCRRFILPGDRLNIGDVVASYRSFQAYEQDLRELRDQLARLEVICGHHRDTVEAARDTTVAQWLSAELARDHARASAADLRALLERLEADFAREAARIAELDRMLPARRAEIKQLQAAIHQMPGGADYLAIKARNEALAAEIQQLQETGTSVDSALRARVRNARAWLAEVRSTRFPAPVATEALEHAIGQLEGCSSDRTEPALRLLSETARGVVADISRVMRPGRERLEQVRTELGRLREEVAMLENGIPPGPRRLLSALNEALPAQGREPAAVQLRELCEVTDEKWRAAVEVAFTRKFAVVVPVELHARALQVFHQLKGEVAPESLVHPERALKGARPVLPGSLASKIRTDHPVAAAVVSNLFGSLICVDTVPELARHDQAILPDGFTQRGLFADRSRHYDNLPFVGSRGLQQQLAVKRARVQELDAEERQLRPVLDGAEAVTRSALQHFPEYHSLLVDLAFAAALPARRQELLSNIARLNSIDRAGFEERERQLHQLEAEQTAWEAELRELLGSQKRGEIELRRSNLREREADLAQAERAFERVQGECGDVSVFAGRIASWREEILAAYPARDAAARQFNRLAEDARVRRVASWEKLVACRRELAMVYRKYDDLAPEDRANTPWESVRRQIAEANIPDYSAKAAAARSQWEGMFRTQVLSKLDRALREVRDLISLLNSHLRTPIGNDRYQIGFRDNPDFKRYRDLISLNAQCDEDGLFFSHVQGDLRAALEQFLRVLVEEPDSVEAARLLDYRHYFDYDLLVWDARDDQAKPVSVDRQSGKFSGGENQSPYFVAILASYLRAYNRHEVRWRDPSLALVPIDEAFSKLSPERIEDCVRALKQLDLQGMLSMSAGNIPFAFSQCDQLIIVSKSEERRGARSHIRNVPVSISRDSDEGREWMERNS